MTTYYVVFADAQTNQFVVATTRQPVSSVANARVTLTNGTTYDFETRALTGKSRDITFLRPGDAQYHDPVTLCYTPPPDSQIQFIGRSRLGTYATSQINHFSKGGGLRGVQHGSGNV